MTVVRRSRSPVKPTGFRMRVVAERTNARKVARQLWRGLSEFNRKEAGPFSYSRLVLSARSESGRIVGGLILQSYWRESYVELLWLSKQARKLGHGTALIEEAERRARRRGSRLVHLSTYSFQAPGFYEKLGFRRCGAIAGSPKGARRYFYVKYL